jgi:hypothetical protein
LINKLIIKIKIDLYLNIKLYLIIK